MRLRKISELKNIKGKRVLVRVDFNVGIKNKGVPKNELIRIKSSLKTINWLIKKKAKIILATHLGRPEGKFDAKFSVAPLRLVIEKLLGSKIKLAKDVIGSVVLGLSNELPEGKVLLLENVRFYKEEESNDSKFAKELSKLADVYVNDAFAVSHRLHASVSAITKFLPSFAGFLLEDEVKNLSRLLIKPKKPFVVLMGGAKISTKIPVLKNLLKVADYVLLAGGIATTLFLARGYGAGSSLVDIDGLDDAKHFTKNKKIILPVDALLFNKKDNTVERVEISDKPSKICSDDFAVYDIGPKTIKLFGEFIGKANTIVWNGPLGVCEDIRFCRGTKSLAKIFAVAVAGKPFGVVGGGDTLPMIESLPNKDEIDFISTGGGAMLEFLSGKILPGIKPLMK